MALGLQLFELLRSPGPLSFRARFSFGLGDRCFDGRRFSGDQRGYEDIQDRSSLRAALSPSPGGHHAPSALSDISFEHPSEWIMSPIERNDLALLAKYK